MRGYSSRFLGHVVTIAFGPLLKLLSLVVFLFFLCAQQACGGGHTEAVKQSLELADRLVPTPPSSFSQDSSDQRVFIDHSESMNGFVGSTTDSRTSFDEFLDVMPDILPGCKVFRYGQPSRSEPLPAAKEDIASELSAIAVPVEFDNRIHDRRYYRMGFNPDDVLIDILAREQEPVLSVLITDGVESDAGGKVNTRVVDAIRSWLNQGKVFAIICLKSRFTGRFYSERLRAMIDNVSVEERPFYAFVFSPNKREFDELYQKIARRFSGVRTMVFSDDAIICRPELPIDIRASYDHRLPPDKPYHWQMIRLKDLGESEDPLVYKFTYEFASTYPIKALGLRSSIYRHVWDADAEQFRKEGTPRSLDQIPNTYEESFAQLNNRYVQWFSLDVKRIIGSNGQGDYTFYSLEQYPYVKEIAEDVAAMSTRDDGLPANADKTYRFQELIYALLDVHVKDRLIPRVTPRMYFTITNQ